MSAVADFENRLAASFPPEQWGEAGVVVGYSAGPDSTALLAGLVALRDRLPADGKAAGRLIAAHFNHRLRGAESEADEAHAVAVCAKLNVECVVGRGDVQTAAVERGDGVEAAARDARYRFLTETAMQQGLRYIATAHTLDDQAETVLHRLLRGTGIGGLAGIPRVRAVAGGTISVIRPLLTFRRDAVLAYLDERGVTYRTDASNDDVRFTRNRIRHELLPQLAREYNPRVVEALIRLAEQADELREVVADLVGPLVERAVVRNDAAGCEVDCGAFRGAPRHLVREALVAVWRKCGWPQQAMGYDEWDQLAEMTFASSPPKRTFPGIITAHRRGERLMLTIGPGE